MSIAVQRDLLRLAQLHREQSTVLESLAANLTEALADLAAPRPVVHMEKHETEYLTAAEFAALIRVDARTLRTMRKLGQTPPSMQIGTRPRWKREDVQAWLAERGEQ